MAVTIMMAKRRGLVIAGIGAAIFTISFLIAGSVLESGFVGPLGFDTEYLFEGMFDDITGEMLVMPGDATSVSYVVGSGVEDGADSSGSVIMWAIHILDYAPGAELLVTASGSDGTPFGMHRMNDEINFGVADDVHADLLEIEISNTGGDPVRIVAMFSENPEDSELFRDPDSPLNRVVLPLATAGIMAFVGVIVAIVGIAVFAVDLRRHQQQQRWGQRPGRMGRFDDWSDGR